MKRNAFGQLGTGFAPNYHRPFLRYFAPAEGEGGGGEGGEGEGGAGNGGGSEFKPPSSQDELNRIIADRVARAERSAREDERRKIASAAKPEGQNGDGAEKPGDKPAAGVSEVDVDKRIADALAAKDLELAIERVGDALDKALEGRTFSASKLLSLDRSQFVKDGKSVDADKLANWVKENSTEAEQQDQRRRRTIPGQGDRDSNATGGSVSAGRDLYDEQHKKKSGKD